MKKSILYTSLSVLAVSVIIGCGGGGGSGGGALTKIDAKKVDEMGKAADKLLPGCTYASGVDVGSVNVEQMLAYDLVYRKIKPMSKVVRSERQIEEHDAGPCGGTLSISGEHDNGHTEVTYTYTDYCMGKGDVEGSGQQFHPTVATESDRVILNGSVNLVQEGPYDSPNSTTATTAAKGLKVESVVEGKHSTKTVFMDSVTLDKDSLVAKSISVDNNKVTGLDIQRNDSGDTRRVKVKSGKYSDPTVGTVEISSDWLEEGKPGSITLKGEEGEAVFTTTGNNIFSAKFGEKVVGHLDCGELLN